MDMWLKLQERIPSKGLKKRLGLNDIILVLKQNRLQWYGHVLRKEDNDWVKKCMGYEVEGPRPRGRHLSPLPLILTPTLTLNPNPKDLNPNPNPMDPTYSNGSTTNPSLPPQ